MAEALLDLAATLYNCSRLTEEEEEVLRAIAESATIQEAAERLGDTVEGLSAKLGKLRSKGVLPKSRNYKALRTAAMLAVLCRGGAVPRP